MSYRNLPGEEVLTEMVIENWLAVFSLALLVSAITVGCSSTEVSWLRCEDIGFAVFRVVDAFVLAAEVVGPLCAGWNYWTRVPDYGACAVAFHAALAIAVAVLRTVGAALPGSRGLAV
jgi:hypothetical protein